MMIKRIFLFLSSFVLLTQSGKGQHYRIHEFNKYSMEERIAAIGEDDNIFLGRPSNLLLMNGKLGMYDYYDGKMITWITLMNKEYIHEANRGNGPNDFIPPLCLYSKNNGKQLQIFERSKGIFRVYDWKDVEKGNYRNPIKVTKTGTIGGIAVPCGDNYLVNEMLDDKKMYSLISSEGDLLCRFGRYPGELDYSRSPMHLQMLTQCLLSANLDGSVMVGAGYMSDMLSFYQIEGTETALLKEYFTKDVELNIVQKGQNVFAKGNGNTINGYLALYSTSKYLYALYWGTKRDEKPTCCYIQQFEWDGVFKKGWKIEEPLTSFAVDEQKGILYGLSAKGEPHINVYEIKDR